MGHSKWSSAKAEKYWRGRKANVISTVTNLRQKLVMSKARRERTRGRNQRRVHFEDQNLFPIRGEAVATASDQVPTELEFWCKYLSWTFCKDCRGLVPQKLLPTYVKRNKLVGVVCDGCKSKKYEVPVLADIPRQLRGLSMEEVVALRPLQIHSGDYNKVQHGYRVHTQPFKLMWCSQSVEEKINFIEDGVKRERAQVAFQYLMKTNQCQYNKFVQMQRRFTRQPFLYEPYTDAAYKGVESALWPHLYYKDGLCESLFETNETKKSSKMSFMKKVHSPVLDYCIQYQMLHYHYDRWIFKTITGAINSSKSTKCSPAQSLESKDFSELFWRNQHGFLIDAVRQHGYPSMFITISPYEWSFPFAHWIENIRQKSGRSPTDLAVFETLNIAHTLEQIIRGYICGKNSNRWKNHLFASKSVGAGNNVNHYFYRFEFQQRGTLHAHILLWLNDLNEVDLHSVSACVPRTSLDDAFQVYDLQKSNKTTMSVYLGPTSVLREGDNTIVKFHYEEADERAKIRGFIPALLKTLKCSMDVQSADGRGMLLKYVSSYVTKIHDQLSQQELFSRHITGYQAANSFLRHLQPLEPEMAMQLTNVKLAWNDARTKTMCAPSSSQEPNAVYSKYLHRSAPQEDYTYLDWLRHFDTNKSQPVPYKRGNTFVGFKYFSIFNAEFFYQVLTMHYQHRKREELLHEKHQNLPLPVRFYSQAVSKLPEIFGTPEKFVQYLCCEAHKKNHLENAAAYIKSLEDVLALCRIHVVDNQFGSQNNEVPNHVFSLSMQQNVSCNKFLSLARRSRRLHYGSQNAQYANADESTATSCTTYQMLLSLPGTGKSQILKKLIARLIEEKIKVAFCAPLAILASAYRELFQEKLHCDTVHGLFYIPVDSGDMFSINYSLHYFDVLIVDEASMITEASFKYIHRTVQGLPHQPLLQLTGDERQQPPLQTVNNKTRQAPSLLHNRELRAACEINTVYKQFRLKDKPYSEFLQYIRYTQPTQELLDNFQRPLVLFHGETVSDDQIWTTVKSMLEAKFLTISRSAADRVNLVVLKNVFIEVVPLSDISLQHSEESYPPMKNMRVVITKNLNKSCGLVNGRECKILDSQNRTLLVQFVDGKRNFIYPMSSSNDEGHTVVKYPLLPCYAQMVCKTQGANICTMIVWFDCPAVPSGTAYVALSRVRDSASIRFLTAAKQDQFRLAVR